MVFGGRNVPPGVTDEDLDLTGDQKVIRKGIEMLPQRLIIALILAIAVFFIAVLWLLKNRRLALKYTLLWFLTGFILLLLVIFPNLMSFAASLVGIKSRMNALYIFLIAFLILLVFSLTSIVSRQTDRIRDLAQSQAILEKRVRELEESDPRVDLAETVTKPSAGVEGTLSGKGGERASGVTDP